MGGLAELAFTAKALEAAWHVVLANDRADGTLAPGTTRFSENADAHIEELAAQLADGRYSPSLLTPVTIVSGTKERVLHVPSIRDRIVARAILAAVTPLVDPHLGPAAYAYRPGLGVADAIQAVAALRAEGLGTVVRTDVRDCFPTLPKHTALRRFSAITDDEGVSQIVAALLDRGFRQPSGGIRVVEGVAQGCPLSPLLANLILVDLDRALLRQGFPVIRYADLCRIRHKSAYADRRVMPT